MVSTRSSSRADLLDRRAAILKALGVTLPELVERRAAGTLTPDEWEAWDELDAISYLLGDGDTEL
jgi:hypothetical protein